MSQPTLPHVNERDWDEVAATFEEDIFSVPANDRLGLIAERVRRSGAKDRSVADLGCGIGRMLPLLAECFGEVHAMDISSECLAVAERKNEQLGSIRYTHVDLSVAELPHVDLALCINVLLTASLSKRQVMLSNACGSIKPEGHLLLTTPSLESALYASHRLVQWNIEKGMSPSSAQQRSSRDASRLDMGIVMIDGVPTKHYLKEELEDVLRAEGMRVEEILKIEYPWSAVFPEAPEWMQDPLPWNWMVVAQR